MKYVISGAYYNWQFKIRQQMLASWAYWQRDKQLASGGGQRIPKRKRLQKDTERMIDTQWELVKTPTSPVKAYLCCYTALPTLKPLKTQPDAKSDMFGDIRAAANADGVTKDGEIGYMMRLPYTETALRNRFERGADVPPGYQAAVFTITQTEDETAESKVA